jgi:hypothetical protein
MTAMSTKIRLYFREQVMPYYKDIGIFTIRLMCRWLLSGGSLPVCEK